MIIFVLHEPENPENIGAAARAIKNMGFRQLRLVHPPDRWQERGRKMAPHALDVFEGAEVFGSLAEALKDVQWVYGTSRRAGPRRGSFLPFSETIKKIKRTRARIALVFGKESKGLNNQAVRLCDWVTAIPTHADCPSVNLAQAVMICAFALSALDQAVPAYRTRGTQEERKLLPQRFIPKGNITSVLAQMEEALVVLGYQHGTGGRTVDRILATWQRLIKRTGLFESEEQMLYGLTRRIREKVSAKNTYKLSTSV